jgi:UPF0755 protein
MTRVVRWLALGAGGLAVVVTLTLGLLFHLFGAPGPLPEPTLVVVSKGLGVSAIGDVMVRHGIVSSARMFEAGVRITGNAGALRAGEYQIPAKASARDVMEVLRSGKTYVRRLTAPEGTTTAQVVNIVATAYGLVGEAGPAPAEGALLPNTYHYSFGDRRRDMIAGMERAMADTVASLWRERAEGLPIQTPREAVILASIVEKETGKPEERALIAGVFYNRLRIGMALQSDPTVAYGRAVAAENPERVLGRSLTRKDIETPDPFNTYLNRGLPPQPICNPGRAALLAVLHPAPTDALYFVADGSGGHVFAKTLDEHNRNVARWRLLRDGRQPAPAAP